jgi:hypothetical protein
MLTENQLGRKREYRTMHRRKVHKLYKALKTYPRQMALRDQAIATQKHVIEVCHQTITALTKRVKELEEKTNKKGIITL